MIGSDSLDTWLGNALYTPMIQNRAALTEMIRRSMEELKALHAAYGVK